MNKEAEAFLAALIRGQQIGTLGTLMEGAPYVSMVVYAPASDFSAFYLHLSRLSHHTRNLLNDERSSLLIAETPDNNRNPLTLRRFSVRGTTRELPTNDPDYTEARHLYLARFPRAAVNFQLSDFSMFRFTPIKARFVAGFGKIFNLDQKSIVEASQSL